MAIKSTFFLRIRRLWAQFSPAAACYPAFAGQGQLRRRVTDFALELLQGLVYAGAMLLLGVARRVPVSFLPWLFATLGVWFFVRNLTEHAAVTLRENAPLWQGGICPPGTAVCASVLGAAPTLLLWTALAVFAALFTGELRATALWLPYYALCALCYGTAQALNTAAFSLFSPQYLRGVKLTLFLTFWGTPILWPASVLSGFLSVLCRLNPLYYLIAGFRDSLLLGAAPLWNDTLWFWLLTALLLFVGYTCFARLRPHFGEVAA